MRTGQAYGVVGDLYSSVGLPLITAVAIGVLNRRLGFADASQTTEPMRLGQGCGVIYLKCPAEECEHLLPSPKKRVSPIRNIPDGRKSELISHEQPLVPPGRQFLDHASSFLADERSFPSLARS